MAESIITSLLGKVGTLMLEEAIFLGGVETQILSLHDELEWINSFLRDADEKRKKNKSVNIWVSQIRNLAYFAEDILDLYMLEVMRQPQKNIGLRTMSYKKKHLFTLHKLGNQLEDINRRLEKISANKSKYGIEAIEAAETPLDGLDDGFTWNKVRRVTTGEEVDDVVGFEKDIVELATLLTKQDSPQFLVVSIVGMGGLGKTTVAKKIYNRNDVKESFDSCAWIYVSQQYRIKDLLFLAVSQLTRPDKQELRKKNEEELKNMLSHHMKENRCLLVFDDVWKTQDWDTLKTAFLSPHQNDKGKQQRVLLPTRILEVAKHADPSNASAPRQLKPLDKKEGFELFTKKVLQFQMQSDQQRSIDNKDLEKVGRELVAECGGLPLAIVTLGGVLSTKPQKVDVWQKTLESVKWQLNQGQEQCMSILALSYMDLPYYLKSCFLYFSIFPEDHEIESERLIRLWVAEGFIQQRGNESMEDVAEEYLEELIDRSMIQAAKRRSDGSVETCRIHDLLRDIAVSEAKEEKLVGIYGSSSNNCSASTCLNRFRWLGIHSENNNGMYHVLSSSSILYHLHSLLDFSSGGVLVDKKMWKGFNLLRVLDLEGAENIRTLPKEIGGLVLLKYLSLKGTCIKRIPHSMGNLCNLQTLDLSYTNLRDIPKEIWRMQQLRHLYCHDLWVSRGRVVECMEKVMNKIGGQSGPSRINNLSSELQTLCLHNGSWIGAVDKLTNLRLLQITYSGPRSTFHGTEALIVSLAKLEKLRVVSLSECFPPNLFGLVSFSHHVHLRRIELDGILEKIPALDEFPPYLTELILRWSHLKEEGQPMATLEKLPNLKILRLEYYAVEGKEMICSAGGFAKLQELRIYFFHDLEELQVQQGAFPCLKVLTIGHCINLKMIPDGLRYVTTLQDLNIRNMPDKFKGRIQKDSGEDWEKIKHIPSLIISGKYIK